MFIVVQPGGQKKFLILREYRDGPFFVFVKFVGYNKKGDPQEGKEVPYLEGIEAFKRYVKDRKTKGKRDSADEYDSDDDKPLAARASASKKPPAKPAAAKPKSACKPAPKKRKVADSSDDEDDDDDYRPLPSSLHPARRPTTRASNDSGSAATIPAHTPEPEHEPEAEPVAEAEPEAETPALPQEAMPTRTPVPPDTSGTAAAPYDIAKLVAHVICERPPSTAKLDVLVPKVILALPRMTPEQVYFVAQQYSKWTEAGVPVPVTLFEPLNEAIKIVTPQLSKEHVRYLEERYNNWNEDVMELLACRSIEYCQV